MKGVIVDLRDGEAAALCEDGRVVRLTDAAYVLGQTVEVFAPRKQSRKWLRYVSSVAAAAVLVAGIGGGAAYATPYGVVSLDVNPSIEYTINRFDYVLSVEGVNEDGRELLAGMDRKQLLNRRIDAAIEASVAQLEAGDWLDGETDAILLTAGTKEEAHSEQLIRKLETGLRRDRDDCTVRALAVSAAEVDAAHEDGMSAGRRQVLRELSESTGPDFRVEDWADRPIRDLLWELDPAQAQDRDRPEIQTPERDTRDIEAQREEPRDGEPWAAQSDEARRETQPDGERWETQSDEAYSSGGDARPDFQPGPRQGGSPQH